MTPESNSSRMAIPPPLMTGAARSFAHRTMTQRIPSIVQQALDDNAARLSERQRRALAQLKEDVMFGRPLPAPTAASHGSGPRHRSWWSSEWAKHTHNGERGWLDIPWFFAEAYLYHVILGIVDFDDTREDPFAVSKRKELEKDSTWELLRASLASTRVEGQDVAVVLGEVLELGVWGNQADGCYQQVLQLQDQGGANSGLVIDERKRVCDYLVALQNSNGLSNSAGVKIAVVTDNAGKELLMDLLLADWLLQHGLAQWVELHIKGAPTFVSDATLEDVMGTIDAVHHHGETSSDDTIREFAVRLRTSIDDGRLVLSPHQFWNSCLHFWDMPEDVKQLVGTAAITFINGDANYRRLLGDSVAWDPCTTMTKAANFWPTPFVCLRTLKSDPIIGFSDVSQVDELDRLFGYDWRVDGQRGVVQTGNFPN